MGTEETGELSGPVARPRRIVLPPRPGQGPAAVESDIQVHHIRRVLTSSPRTADHIDGPGADKLVSAWIGRGYRLTHTQALQNPPGAEHDPNWPKDGTVMLWVVERER